MTARPASPRPRSECRHVSATACHHSCRRERYGGYTHVGAIDAKHLARHRHLEDGHRLEQQRPRPDADVEPSGHGRNLADKGSPATRTSVPRGARFSHDDVHRPRAPPPSVSRRLPRGHVVTREHQRTRVRRRPAPGAWTAREVVHHLADSEATSYLRLRRVLAEENPLIPAYDEECFARRLHYERPVEASLAVLKAVRTASAELLDTLEPHEWDRSGVHSDSGPYSVETWLGIYADHAHDHADQIRRARASASPSVQSPASSSGGGSRVLRGCDP